MIKCEQVGTLKGKGYNDMNGRVYSDSGLSSSIRANSGGHNEIKVMPTYDMRIRKLTPKECFRLMDFDDEDCDKCVAAGISNSQLYKQAGNSIVVACLEAIFRELL